MRLVMHLFAIPFGWRQRKAMASRANVSQEDFISALARNPFEREVAELLWLPLRDQASVPDFRPLPDDSLEKMYGIAEEELDEDILLSLMDRFRIAVPGTNQVKEFGAVESPRDVMRFIAFAREQASAS